jgi:hypothetical protein
MANRVLLALVVAVGLAGCGGASDSEKTNEGAVYQNAVVLHGENSTFTLQSGGKTIDNIPSFQVSDEPKSSREVQSFIQEADQKLCCDSCSLSGGVLICTGCSAC